LINDKQREMIREIAKKLSCELADQGRLTEGGWKAFETMFLPTAVNEDQRHDMRIAFFAGAQHIFHTMVSIAEEGTEATPNDLSRFQKLDDELTEFAEYMAKHYGVKL